MARPRTVDREGVLRAAEQVLAEKGVSALSFGSVATAADVSKATVQSIFRTREGLIEAMLERWTLTENARLDDAVSSDSSLNERIAAHVRLAGTEPPESSARTAALLAALSGAGEISHSVLRWYEDRVGAFTVDGPLSQSQRVAFLAAEGALFLRYLIGFPFSEAVWADLFTQLEEMANSEQS